MTIQADSRQTSEMLTNGEQKTFSFDFPVFKGDNYQKGVEVRFVTDIDFTVVDSSEFLVIPNTENSGGVVQFTQAPVAGKRLVIVGSTTVDQQLDITNFSKFIAQSIETNFDKIVAILQEIYMSLDEETRQRINNDKKLETDLNAAFNRLANSIDVRFNSKWEEIATYLDAMLPMFFCIMRKEIAEYAKTGLIDVIDTRIAELMNDIKNTSEQALSELLDYYRREISKISAEGGVPSIAVSTASGSNQAEVNKQGGFEYWSEENKPYNINHRVILNNGNIVKSTVNNNTKNPNLDMTGWVNISVEKIDGLQHLQFNKVLNKDGSSSPVQDFLNVLANRKSIALPTDHYRPLDEVVFDGQDFYLDGNGAKLECTVNRRAITGYNTALGNQKFTLLNTYIKQQWNPDTGSGGANNNAPIHVNGLKNPRVFFNTFESSVGVSTNVATVDNVNHGTEFAHIMFNHFRDVQKQCVETFGSAHNVVVGNTGDVPLLNSNALRLTGASSPTAVYNKASVYAANTFKGGQGETASGKYAAGISVQTYVQGASAVANASQGFHWGVNLKSGVDLAGQSRGNYIQHSNVDSDYAVYAESPRSQQVNITAYNYKDGGIKEVTTANSDDLLKGVMKYSGILVAGMDTVAPALDILNDGSQFNILIDLQEGGQTNRNVIRGKNHNGVIGIYNSDNGALFLRCDDSNLQITVKDIDDTSNSKVSIRVYGNNNTLTVNTKGSVRFEETASGNILYGRIGRVECLATTSNNTFYGKASAVGGFGVSGNTQVSPIVYTETFDPESILADSSITKVVTVVGAVLGQTVNAAFSVYNANIDIYSAVSASNTVTVRFKNTSASPIDLASGVLRVLVS